MVQSPAVVTALEPGDTWMILMRIKMGMTMGMAMKYCRGGMEGVRRGTVDVQHAPVPDTSGTILASTRLSSSIPESDQSLQFKRRIFG